MIKKVKDLSILTVGHFVQAVILLISVRLLTFYLSPEEMGRYALIYTGIFFFFSFFITPASMFFQRKIFEWHEQGQSPFTLVRIVLYIGSVALGAGFLVMLIQRLFFPDLGIMGWHLFSLIFSIIFFQYLTAFCCDWLNIFQRRVVYVCCTISAVLLGLFFSVYFSISFGPNAVTWLWGQVAGYAVMGFVSVFFVKRLIGPQSFRSSSFQEEKKLLKDFVKFSWPIALASLVMWFQTQSYRFLFEHLHGLAVLGLFVVGFNISSRLMEKVSVLFTSFYHPFFFKQIANSTKEERVVAWQKYASAYIPALILVVIYILGAAGLLTNVFIDQQFHDVSAMTIGFGVLTIFFLEVGAVYKMIGVSELNMKGLLIPHLAGAAVVLLGLVTLSKLAGPFLGAGFALLGGAMVTCGVLVIEMKKILPVKLPAGVIINSALFSMPIVILFILQHYLLPYPTIAQSLAVLTGVGVYFLVAQFFLARKWLLHDGQPKQAMIDSIETDGAKAL